MRIVLLSLNILAFLASVVWLYFEPNFEPLITSLLTLVGIISFGIFKPKKNKPTHTSIKMNQKAGNKSTQYQSGNDMTINN